MQKGSYRSVKQGKSPLTLVARKPVVVVVVVR